MKEAYRLLNKSIIRVDTPDVSFDPGEDEKTVEGMVYLALKKCV